MSAPWTSLAAFTPTHVLSAHTAIETCALLGRVQGSDAPALVVIRRKPLAVGDASALAVLCSTDTSLERQLQNDVYGQYTATLPPQGRHAQADVVVVHPAGPLDIAKHTEQAVRLVRETPALYRDVVAPAIAVIPPARLQWVWNILDGTAEADRVLYRTPPKDRASPRAADTDDDDDGFVIVPNLDWDPRDTRSLHCLAIVHRRDIASLRNVRSSHLPLLRRVWTDGRAAVAAAYGVPVDRLRAYVHYRPSFYHLHVHIAHVDVVSPSVAPERAHPLPDIIDNLERFGDAYYVDKTFTVSE